MRACWQLPCAAFVRAGGASVVPLRESQRVALYVGMNIAQAMGWVGAVGVRR